MHSIIADIFIYINKLRMRQKEQISLPNGVLYDMH